MTDLEVPRLKVEGFRREKSSREDGAVFYVKKHTSSKVMVKPITLSDDREVFIIKSYEGTEHHDPPNFKNDRIAENAEELERKLSYAAAEV